MTTTNHLTLIVWFIFTKVDAEQKMYILRPNYFSTLWVSTHTFLGKGITCHPITQWLVGTCKKSWCGMNQNNPIGNQSP